MTLGVAERRVCRVLGQSRSTQRYRRQPQDDQASLTAAIIALASQYGRYGYRQVTGLLRNDERTSQSQTGRANLAARRPEGAEEAATSAAALAYGWLLRSSPSGTAEPCVGV